MKKNSLLLILIIVMAAPALACTLPDWVVTPTSIPTATETASATATNTLQPTETMTPSPTITNTATLEPTLTPTKTKTATLSPTPVVYAYQIQPGTPAYLSNLFHSELGENWMGIGGQVFDQDGNPQKFIVVRVQGQIDGTVIDATGMTGSALNYGPGGYEITLGDQGIASSGSLKITIYDLEGNQLSNAISFDTYTDTDKLQIIINFTASQ